MQKEHHHHSANTDDTPTHTSVPSIQVPGQNGQLPPQSVPVSSPFCKRRHALQRVPDPAMLHATLSSQTLGVCTHTVTCCYVHTWVTSVHVGHIGQLPPQSAVTSFPFCTRTGIVPITRHSMVPQTRRQLHHRHAQMSDTWHPKPFARHTQASTQLHTRIPSKHVHIGQLPPQSG